MSRAKIQLCFFRSDVTHGLSEGRQFGAEVGEPSAESVHRECDARLFQFPTDVAQVQKTVSQNSDLFHYAPPPPYHSLHYVPPRENKCLWLIYIYLLLANLSCYSVNQLISS